MLRELGRLETSLKAAGNRESSFSPLSAKTPRDYECREILDLLEKYRVTLCCYGHIHSKGRQLAFEGYYQESVTCWFQRPSPLQAL